METALTHTLDGWAEYQMDKWAYLHSLHSLSRAICILVKETHDTHCPVMTTRDIDIVTQMHCYSLIRDKMCLVCILLPDFCYVLNILFQIALNENTN